MRDSYPSDISREQFEPLQAIFEQSKQQTKPRVVDLYDVLCAILYVLKSGCQLMVSSACLSRRKKMWLARSVSTAVGTRRQPS